MITITPAYQADYLSSLGIYTSADLLRVWAEHSAHGSEQFCFFSTSGTHGSYTNLDQIESTWGKCVEEEGGYGDRLTVVLYQSRLVNTWRGEITVALEDIPALRELCLESVKNILDSQCANLPLGHLLRIDPE